MMGGSHVNNFPNTSVVSSIKKSLKKHYFTIGVNSFAHPYITHYYVGVGKTSYLLAIIVVV